MFKNEKKYLRFFRLYCLRTILLWEIVAAKTIFLLQLLIFYMFIANYLGQELTDDKEIFFAA